MFYQNKMPIAHGFIEACGLGFSPLLTFVLSVAGQPKSIQEAISTILGSWFIQLSMRKNQFQGKPGQPRNP